MTATLLQKSLCKEIECLTSHMRFKNSDKVESKLKAYAQNLPLDKEESELAPYVIVKISDGDTMPDGKMNYYGRQSVNIELFICIHDEEDMAQGELDVLNIIYEIIGRFSMNTLLDNQYIADKKIVWSLQTEMVAETFPKYYGGMYLQFFIPNFEDEGSIYT